MKMIEIVGAFLLGGVTGAVAKDKILGSAQKENSKQNELDSLYAENQKFSKRNKELERQIEDLLAELNKVRKQVKTNDDNADNLEDELDKAKRELKNVRFQNDELARKLKEYKIACESLESEIASLKQSR
jgi:uncharacterized coiled-coil DUF342 family protein